ncbi:MAG TPA: hypothetical protein ENG24_00540 [Thermoplasmatales archaeon]|nr:hypothetical protein [Thermoplasmatales archaeon]
MISNNYQGIHLYKHSNNNSILGNTILDNNEGIYIFYSCRDNIFYYNSFINNTVNVFYDGCKKNTWYDAIARKGNYWSDYNGTDVDGDGIGDVPYEIEGGDGNNLEDKYPLVTPPKSVQVNKSRGTPGFEIILVLTVMMIFFWKRKIIK